ncbi:hypothetical protein [Ketobacter alkanivorans]|uniref:Uncharacterized protein n=1 Tax=Ketobacter alkanivorans TaxID=1917421 RepID=A0A2K9LID6_9GAMM|nr:hypothetical protein [Ketobacter alkanivorans]AUM12118.1 hypothetical protein Kalk_06705 [Ketobacter alkanivorans]
MDVFRLSVIYRKPSFATDKVGLSFFLYENDHNHWRDSSQGSPVAKSPGAIEIFPGGMTYDIPRPDVPLDRLWLAASGTILPAEFPSDTYLYVAEPPDTHVPDDDAVNYGPPWIGLSELGHSNGLIGSLYLIQGPDQGPDGNRVRHWLGCWALNLIDVSESRPMPPGGFKVSP